MGEPSYLDSSYVARLEKVIDNLRSKLLFTIKITKTMQLMMCFGSTRSTNKRLRPSKELKV